MFIKVCGMRQGANVQEVARLKPDMMGFIFYPKSKRFVGDDFDASIVRSVMPEVQTVGVFVNEEVEKVITMVRKYSLDFVQLHGNESPASCQAIREKGIKVLKAFGIHNEFDWTALEPYTDSCDYFLFDTSTKDYGGSGIKFNWKILEDYKLSKPFVLSGGIGPEDADIIKSIQHPKLAGIDINSRFEVEPGLKNVGLLQTFISKIRTK